MSARSPSNAFYFFFRISPHVGIVFDLLDYFLRSDKIFWNILGEIIANEYVIFMWKFLSNFTHAISRSVLLKKGEILIDREIMNPLDHFFIIFSRMEQTIVGLFMSCGVPNLSEKDWR